jgi:hypothetical protein
MTTSSIRCAGAALVALVALSPAALAGSKPKPPTGTYAFDAEGSGSFRVAEKRVSRFAITPAAGGLSSEACGTAKIRVKGRLRLGTVTSAGYTSWIFGRPSGNDAIPKRVTVVAGGKEVPGRLKLIFDYDNVRKGSGSLKFGDCDMPYFHFKKPRR